jgi:hypothetical protein
LKQELKELKAKLSEPKNEVRLDDDGAVDDVVIGPVKLFRLERMAEDTWWLRLYMPDGNDFIFWLQGKGPVVATVEREPPAADRE